MADAEHVGFRLGLSETGALEMSEVVAVVIHSFSGPKDSLRHRSLPLGLAVGRAGSANRRRDIF